VCLRLCAASVIAAKPTCTHTHKTYLRTHTHTHTHTRTPRLKLTAILTRTHANARSLAGDALPDMCVAFHNSVHQLSARFLAEQRRHYYVTPTSYLELLGSYKSLLGRRQVCYVLDASQANCALAYTVTVICNGPNASGPESNLTRDSYPVLQSCSLLLTLPCALALCVCLCM